MHLSNFFKAARPVSIALLVAVSSISSATVAKAQSQAIDVEAGPIFSNEQAEAVCPELATALGGTWTGNWVTTVFNEMSVCNINFGDSGSFRRLTTMFLEDEGKCLEGNRYAPESVLQGAAFMDNCQNVSGQLWRFE